MAQSEAARVRDRIGSMMADGNIASVKLTKARKSYSCDGQWSDGRCAANIKVGDEYVRVVSYPHASRDGGYSFRTSYVICVKCAGVARDESNVGSMSEQNEKYGW